MHLKIVIFYVLLATAWFVITAIPVLLSVLLPKVPRSIGRDRRQLIPAVCADSWDGTSNADWWDARVTWQLTPLSLVRLSTRVLSWLNISFSRRRK